ncbi:MAG: T9SS type A sorting domain-containing protein [Chitinophagales bacterium]
MQNKYSLLQYSLSAAALLQSAATYSQVIYTDVEPDVILDEPGEVWGFDLDADGLNDFNFFNRSFTTTVWYGDEGQVKVIYAGAFDSIQNGLIGKTAYFSGYGGYTYYLPSPLDFGFEINNLANFNNANYQTLANEIFKPEFPPTTGHFGYWYPWYGEDITNQYLGFRFTDEESVQRYGWIRCSVIDSGHTLIIHDYAYESQPNHPIAAGSLETYVAIENNNPLYSIYSFGNTIYYHLPSEDIGSEITLFDLAGRIIYSGNITETNSSISPNCLPGIYVVRITTSTQRITRKVSIGN